MSAQHTPGPWRVDDYHDGFEIVGNVARATRFGKKGEWTVASIEMDMPDGAETANAHLIAAAPDLLAALEALVSSFETHRPKLLWDNARAAIAKAAPQ
ncbi:hypothetical protein D3Y57_19045 [Sphingomonas paeninsulae]|uniref:Uncharacterized protein n=1 Tax=Sphingomonas paeninsulae TaxID=2319844 RepID=A0A494TJE8_SPHPE|nr:hypothetical protein [Sphingomonas paeninsulae]AYJ87634.1 hypothetical protein D3Y57_19045 [Sphingomonas paeninsulae]